MGVENPLLNFRCPVEVKDLLTIHARREGAEVGPMLRQWMELFVLEFVKTIPGIHEDYVWAAMRNMLYAAQVKK